MAQLRDAAGTAIGIATGGPQPSNTTIQVPVPGTYRLEVWPFGAGPWAVTVSYVSSPTAAPTLAPVTVTSAAPTAVVTSAVPTTPVPTTLETTTTVTTAVPTTTPTTPPTPAQASRSLRSDTGGFYSPELDLNAGLAIFTFSTEGTGSFLVTLIDSAGTKVAEIVETEGPIPSGSQAISVPATGKYLLNIIAPGKWEISVA